MAEKHADELAGRMGFAPPGCKSVDQLATDCMTQSEPRGVPRKDVGMAKLVFGMNQSLDGYVDHTAFGPSPTLFRHFIQEAQGQAGSVYGRQMYEIMRYWDDDDPEWDAEEQAFAVA
ncbi:MAG TPA: hypothetical protein VGX50_01265, partial [Longimicrobium sp.]|nr:hypothetical protein [Longimicrobium sp.]